MTFVFNFEFTSVEIFKIKFDRKVLVLIALNLNF